MPCLRRLRLLRCRTNQGPPCPCRAHCGNNHRCTNVEVYCVSTFSRVTARWPSQRVHGVKASAHSRGITVPRRCCACNQWHVRSHISGCGGGAADPYGRSTQSTYDRYTHRSSYSSSGSASNTLTARAAAFDDVEAQLKAAKSVARAVGMTTATTTATAATHAQLAIAAQLLAPAAM